MWIFSSTGFVSVVEDVADRNRLVVRARIAGDLDSLRSYVANLSATVSTPTRDYPYRAYCSREDLSAGLAKLAVDIDYSNFKGEVMRTQGLPRERVYEQVWSVMRAGGAKLDANEVAPSTTRRRRPQRAER